MKVSHFGIRLAAIVIVAWPLLDNVAIAQRGERGGGDRGGARSGERGGGDRGGRSFSGRERQGQSGTRRAPGGGQRGTRDAERSRSTFQQRGSDRGRFDAQRARNADPQRREGSPQQRQSFYQGSESDRDRQQFDRSRTEREYQADRRDSRDFRDTRGSRSDWDRDWQARDRQDWRGNVDWDDRFDRDRDRDNWRRSADRIRRSWWNDWNRPYVPFRYGWWDDYSGIGWPVYSPWLYTRWQNQPYYWWGYTPAGRLASWFVWGGRPAYWSYGPGGYYYRDGWVYYDDRRYLSADRYYDQVRSLATDVPQVTRDEAAQMDWSPLGVFALTRPNQQQSHRTLQIAVNRDGVLTGTYFNQVNDHVHPILGKVDEQTQRAAWSFADGEHPSVVFETSIYNLTRDEADMMVHFGPSSDETEIWQLVRLEQPQERTAQSASTRSAP